MKDFDDQLRDAFKNDPENLMANLDEPAIFEQVIETFRGRNRWINIMAFCYTFAGLGVAVFAAYQFFQVDSPKAYILWATVFLWSAIWIAMLKIWFWLEMQKNSVIREVKRVELRLMQLSSQVGAGANRHQDE